MKIEVQAPRVSTSMDSKKEGSICLLYQESIHELLKKTLPHDLFFDTAFPNSDVERVSFLNDSLPIIHSDEIGDAPCNLSVIMLCKYRFNAAHFFYDLVSRWLVPNKRLNIELFFASDFKLPDYGENTYTISQIMIRLNSTQEVEEVRRNLRSVETELRLGVVSTYHANRILEFKGLSSDKKTSLIQEKIGSLIHSPSKEIDRTIFSQMQRFLVTCREEFKSVRDYHHISRIISVLHVIRKLLKQKIEVFPNKRHLIVKFLKTRLAMPGKERTVLGILVGLNFLREHEVFEEKHLLNAVKSYIPNVKAVENSFFLDRNRENTMQTIYLEIEKEDGKVFSFEEIQRLRKVLPDRLKGHIEYLMHPTFMPRNEEEVVKNIMTLSRQLKYVHDIPQVIISYEEQKNAQLSFTVILLRVLKPADVSIQKVFHRTHSFLKFVPDRVRKVGTLRRRYPKEATVFRVLMPKQKYIRADHSVDLYQARQEVLTEIYRVLGEVRDYNGGLIHKQNEVYLSLKTSLGSIGKQHEFLLEKFFYSIVPVEMRSVVKPEALKHLFLMLLSAMNKKKTYSKKMPDWLFKQDGPRLYVIIPINDPKRKARVMDAVEGLNLLSSQLVSFYLDTYDLPFLGYILHTEDKEKQRSFLQKVGETLE